MLYSHNKKAKAFLGNIKVKKAYIGTQKVYSAGNVVTYHIDVDQAPITREIDSDASCLTIDFTPTKSGWHFKGWRKDTMASEVVETNLLMGDEPIDLYAVFDQDVTLTTVVSGKSEPHTKKSHYNNDNYAYALFTIPDPTLEGATFMGWTWDGVNIAHPYIKDLPVTEDVTRYAVFQYSNDSVSRQFYNKQEAFYPADAETNGYYMTLVPDVNLSKYSGITIAFDSVNLTQASTTHTVYLTAKCGGASIDLYSDYYEYTGTHYKTEISGSKTLNFTNSSGVDKCIIVFRGDGYCNGGSFGASATLLGRTVVG